MPALRLLAGVLPSLLMTLTLAGCSDTAEERQRKTITRHRQKSLNPKQKIIAKPKKKSRNK